MEIAVDDMSRISIAGEIIAVDRQIWQAALVCVGSRLKQQVPIFVYAKLI